MIMDGVTPDHIDVLDEALALFEEQCIEEMHDAEEEHNPKAQATCVHSLLICLELQRTLEEYSAKKFPIIRSNEPTATTTPGQPNSTAIPVTPAGPVGLLSAS